MSESDPYETSYKPKLNDAVERVAAKRLRKQSESRGNRARQEIEGKAPDWKNEGSAKSPTAPKGSSVGFNAGSYSGGLHFNIKRQGRSY
jgi:hypothetical protein